MALIAGLNLSSVQRLVWTWKEVPQRFLAVIISFCFDHLCFDQFNLILEGKNHVLICMYLNCFNLKKKIDTCRIGKDIE
jgi:hypothetical protein